MAADSDVAEGEKRGGELVEAAESTKKQKAGDGRAIVSSTGGNAVVAAGGPMRTSELLAPIMLLSGHAGAVLTSKFSPDGRHLLSGSHDKTLLLWEVFGECANTLTFRGHANAVLEAHWLADGEHVISASADKTVALWDARTGARNRQFKGHTMFVNSCCPAKEGSVLASGSDDCNARIWDVRVRTCQRTINHPFAVTSVSVDGPGNQLYTGCLDGNIRVYDLRRWTFCMAEAGHVRRMAPHPKPLCCHPPGQPAEHLYRLTRVYSSHCCKMYSQR
eukprot:4761409-Pleurochrysis_carterae.AAC.1